MAEFTEAQKRFVIECWASDLESREIAVAFVEHFGEGTEQPLSPQLARYNADYAAGETMSKEHKALFARARKKFREDVAAQPAAHLPWRLRELTILYRRQKKKSDVIAAEILKQMAQEVGKIFVRPEPTISAADTDAYVRGMATHLRAAVEKHVTSKDEQDRVHNEIKEIMAREGL